MDAVKAFEIKSGYRFTTFLKFHLKTHFQATLNGGRRRTAKDILNYCDSLDVPIRNDEEDLVLSHIPDPDSETIWEDAEDRIFHEELRNELESCLISLSPERANILRWQFFEGKTLREVAERIGKSSQRVQQIRTQGIRELRKPQYSRRLLPFAEYLDTLAWRSTGYQSFKNSGLSSVERAVEKLDTQANI